MTNGVDEKKRIIGAPAPHPVLYNLPIEYIERFRQQVTLIDLQFKGTPEIIRKAVWSCHQEEPVTSKAYRLYDIGGFPDHPLSGKIPQRLTQLWLLPADEEEAIAIQRM